MLTLVVLAAFFWGLIGAAGLPARRVAAWSFVTVWFIHLIVGAGAVYAAIRLWPDNRNAFIRYTAIHLFAVMLDALSAIVLIFMAVNVRFTWKFSIAFFAFGLTRDAVRLPLILYIIRGPQGVKLEHALTLQEEVRMAIREAVKDEFLK